jgi:hypothetical protein
LIKEKNKDKNDRDKKIIYYATTYHKLMIAYASPSTTNRSRNSINILKTIIRIIDILNNNRQHIPELSVTSKILFQKMINEFLQYSYNHHIQNQLFTVCNDHPVMLAEFLSHNDILTDEPSDDDLKHTIYINNRIKFIDILNNNKEFIPNEYNITKLSMKLFTPAMNSILNDASENQKRRIINLCVKNSFLLEQYIRENIITISNNHSKATKISNMINKINTIQLKNNHMQQKLKII